VLLDVTPNFSVGASLCSRLPPRPDIKPTQVYRGPWIHRSRAELVPTRFGNVRILSDVALQTDRYVHRFRQLRNLRVYATAHASRAVIAEIHTRVIATNASPHILGKRKPSSVKASNQHTIKRSRRRDRNLESRSRSAAEENSAAPQTPPASLQYPDRIDRRRNV